MRMTVGMVMSLRKILISVVLIQEPSITSKRNVQNVIPPVSSNVKPASAFLSSKSVMELQIVVMRVTKTSIWKAVVIQTVETSFILLQTALVETMKSNAPIPIFVFRLSYNVMDTMIVEIIKMKLLLFVVL